MSKNRSSGELPRCRLLANENISTSSQFLHAPPSPLPRSRLAHRAMATPVPHIKSAARKLPIKRKSPPKPDLTLAPTPDSPASPSDDDQYDAAFDPSPEDPAAAAAAAPFKFHRIWTESDEIRFLQGLLGSSQQGMVFPRDLNLFYDRFSSSMPQPYTRSQLSEKLRRLRKKFRLMSARISRGQDMARLAPHDKDLLHLCTRLWDPSHAKTSPFSAPDGSLAPVGNKRRRPNPRPLDTDPLPLPLDAENVALEVPRPEEADPPHPAPVVDAEKGDLPPPPPPGTGPKGGLAAVALDVFNAALSDLRANGGDGSSFEGRWREQRLAEMDVLVRRLRLVIEGSI